MCLCIFQTSWYENVCQCLNVLYKMTDSESAKSSSRELFPKGHELLFKGQGVLADLARCNKLKPSQ